MHPNPYDRAVSITFLFIATAIAVTFAGIRWDIMFFPVVPADSFPGNAKSFEQWSDGNDGP